MEEEKPPVVVNLDDQDNGRTMNEEEVAKEELQTGFSFGEKAEVDSMNSKKAPHRVVFDLHSSKDVNSKRDNESDEDDSAFIVYAEWLEIRDSSYNSSRRKLYCIIYDCDECQGDIAPSSCDVTASSTDYRHTTSRLAWYIGPKGGVMHNAAFDSESETPANLLQKGFRMEKMILLKDIISLSSLQSSKSSIKEDGELKLMTKKGTYFFNSTRAELNCFSEVLTSIIGVKSDQVNDGSDGQKTLLSGNSGSNDTEMKVDENKPPLLGKLQIKNNFHDFEDRSDENSVRDRTIDEMKVQTMFKMVEDVTISLDGRMFDKKLLYLTNKQCSMFDETGILRCIQALDLGEPKCIIRLMFSGGSSYLYKANAQAHMQRLGQWGTYTINGGNINAKDDSDFIQQAIMLMRNCIIPLAKETRALIIINASTNCLLGNVLAEVAVPEQERLGKNCPFKILGFVNGNPFMTYNAVKRIGVAGDLCAYSQVWQSRLPAALQHFGDQDESAYFRVNCNKAVSHYIVFECIDFDVHPSSMNYSPPNRFQTLLASALSRNLPSVAFCCSNGATNGALVEKGGNDWDVTAGMLKVGIPVLFLDLRLRAFTCKKIDPALKLTDLCRHAHQFPRISSTALRRLKFSKDGKLSLKSRKFLFKVGVQMLESHHECILANGSFDRWFYSTFAFLYSVLTLGSTKVNSNEHLALHECISSMRASDSDSDEGLIPMSLVMRACEYINRRLPVQARLQRKQRLENWLKQHPVSVNYLEPQAKKEYQTLIKELFYLQNECDGLEPEILQQQALSLTELFLSNTTYCASLYDLTGVNRIIRKVAKIDRLPDSNSLEANLMIRDAWDHVDLYHVNANTYKLITKLAYFSILLIGILTTIQSILIRPCGPSSDDTSILYISLIGSVVAAFITFLNPALKWQQLRGAALSIESLLWQYRTRTGLYRVHGDDFEIEAIKKFQENVQSVKDFVMDGADIKTSSFFGTTISPNLHLQHPPIAPSNEGQDNHTDDRKNEKFTSRNEIYRKIKLYFDYFVQYLNIFFGFDLLTGAPLPTEMNRIKMRNNNTNSPVKAKPINIEPVISYSSPKSMKGEYNDNCIPKSDPYGNDGEFRYENNEDDDEEISDGDDVEEGMYTFRDVPLANDGTCNLVDVIHMIEEVSGGRNTGADDNDTFVDHHYLPVHPDQYCEFRIKKEIDFYQARIPSYNRARYIGQVMLMLGSVSSSIMAISNHSHWAAFSAICASSVTAWQEFVSTNNKITRYSTTVANLQKLLLWWKTCQPIEKASTDHVDRLVRTCEEALKSDRDAWGSTTFHEALSKFTQD